MLRANLKNRTFDWMGERWAPLVDPHHFLGRSPFDIPWHLDKKKPAVNVKKNGELFEMQVALPGFAKEDIEITVKDDILTICGEKKTVEKEAESDFVIKEFSTDSFERKFKLGKGIGHEKIKAKYENGVLTLTFIDVPTEEEKWYKKVEVS